MSGAEEVKLNESKEGDAEQIAPLDMSDDDIENMSLDDLPEGDDTTGEDDNANAERESGIDDESGSDGESGESGESTADDADGAGSSEDGSESGDSDSGDIDSGSTDGDGDGGESGAKSDVEDGEHGGDGEPGDSGSDGESGSSDNDGSEDGRDPHSGKTEKADSKGKIKQKAEGDERSQNNQLNFEEEHNKLLAPFKANGKDMQIKNVDEARTLMQMGANYNKKMAGLKPNLKLIKMLSNNDLLDEAKLSYLIDLDKKDPAATKKFIQESGVDLEEFDKEAEHGYKSNTYTVDDKEVELDSVIEDIQDTTAFNETIHIVTNKWDESSKAVFASNPSLLKVINQHVAAGVFSKIEAAVEQERMLGRLDGVDDLAAYMQMGDKLHDLGVFDNMNKSKETKEAESNTQGNAEKDNKKPVDSKTRQKKKSASSTKSTSKKKGNDDFNPLALSDEEFEKASGSDFL